jgi:hypothetical protein
LPSSRGTAAERDEKACVKQLANTSCTITNPRTAAQSDVKRGVPRPAERLAFPLGNRGSWPSARQRQLILYGLRKARPPYVAWNARCDFASRAERGDVFGLPASISASRLARRLARLQFGQWRASSAARCVPDCARWNLALQTRTFSSGGKGNLARVHGTRLSSRPLASAQPGRPGDEIDIVLRLALGRAGTALQPIGNTALGPGICMRAAASPVIAEARTARFSAASRARSRPMRCASRMHRG